MEVYFHKRFDKRFVKLPYQVQLKTLERIHLFRQEPFAEILRNHALGGKYKVMHSIDITGDYRALYKPLAEDKALFVNVGSHSQLYG